MFVRVTPLDVSPPHVRRRRRATPARLFFAAVLLFSLSFIRFIHGAALSRTHFHARRFPPHRSLAFTLFQRSNDMKHTFLIQRYHAKLRLDFVPCAARGERLVPVHCRQDQWSSACGPHAVAMSLVLTGDIQDVATLSNRRNGVAARLWHAAQITYFDGTTVTQLATMVDSLEIGRPVAYCKSGHQNCLAFALSHLAAGHAVIVSWKSRSGRDHHWTLVTGVEGMQVGRTFTPQTLLCLDPGIEEPLSLFNARLEFTIHPPPRAASYVRYRGTDGVTLSVKLTSALAIGDATH
jgi:hypothetical protein